jgi:glycosyltransferase involved in cell wall biosynthesis
MGFALRRPIRQKPYLALVDGGTATETDPIAATQAPIYPHLSLVSHPRLRIAHISPSLAPVSGGSATVTARLAAAQAALGHEVTIVSSLASTDREIFMTASRNIPHFDQVRLLLTPWTTNVQSRFGRRSLPIFQSLFPFIDIVHIHGVWEPTLVAAASMARQLKIPYVVRPCGVLDPWSLAQRRFKKKLALALTHKKMLDEAALIHTLNSDEHRLIKPLHIAAPSTIIPNGVFLDEVDETPSDDSLFERFPALSTHPYILFLARLHHQKGLDILADAFTRIAPLHPDVHLLVAGPDGGARDGFLSEIRAHKLEQRVHLPGSLVGPAKATAYRNAACFCLPSRQEGFSLSIIEALASRVPVAISEDCHFPQVQKIGAGRVFPLNAADAAQALHEILSASTPAQRRMGDAGRNYVEQFLTWERVAELTIDAYSDLLQPA